MFNIFKGKGKGNSQRTLDSPAELQAGDIIVLKERRSLPPELQGQQLEVSAVGTYQYSSSVDKEFTLRTMDSKTYYMSVDDNDGDPILCFTLKIPRQSVLDIFDGDEFSLLWEADFPSLTVKSRPEEYSNWLTESYQQIIKNEEGYFYNRDCVEKSPSTRLDDDGEELRYHECEGVPDDNFGLSVEVWGDGETDVFLEIYTPIDVVDELWPHAE